MRHYLIFLIFLFLFSCKNNCIKKNDELLVLFTIENELGKIVDRNFIVGVDTLPLKLKVGENLFHPEIERELIGKNKKEEIRVLLDSSVSFNKNGFFYLNDYDTIYIINKGEKLWVKLKILN